MGTVPGGGVLGPPGAGDAPADVGVVASGGACDVGVGFSVVVGTEVVVLPGSGETPTPES